VDRARINADAYGLTGIVQLDLISPRRVEDAGDARSVHRAVWLITTILMLIGMIPVWDSGVR
jgi:hypothetical protein